LSVFYLAVFDAHCYKLITFIVVLTSVVAVLISVFRLVYCVFSAL